MDTQQALFEMNNTLDKLQQGIADLGGRFDKVDGRLDRVDNRLDKLEATLTNHRVKLAGWAGGASVITAIAMKLIVG